MAALAAALAALTKGGLNAITRPLAIEYASRGIRVNAIAVPCSKQLIICTPRRRPESWAMIIRVEQGKGGKDRNVMLSLSLLNLLRAWCKAEPGLA
jgi:NAD(P)-dependent dehydrogenase (short-subunit alcohol dehydrogenase family)